MNDLDIEIAEFKVTIKSYESLLARTDDSEERKELIKLIRSKTDNLNRLMDQRNAISGVNVIKTKGFFL